MTIETARLGDLSIDEKVNVRKTGRGAEPIFAGSIRARGVKQPLIVRLNGKGYKITDGGKRFDGLQYLKAHGETAKGVPVTDDYPVPILVTEESDAEARDTSLTVNVIRAETHPVDRYEAFAQLIDDGATRETIADAYGMPLREVDKALALGALHPKIRDAWRAGEIRAENAQAFTLAADQKTQIKVFGKLAKSGQLSSRWTIRSELKAEDQEIGHLLAFVGIASYEASGGKVIARDLFEGKHVISDVVLVATLAKEKLAAECQRLVEAGWGWAAPADDMPNNWSWKFGKINPKIEFTDTEQARLKQLHVIADDEDLDWQQTDPAEAEIELIEAEARVRAFGPKQMAKSGCVVDVSDSGELQVAYGLIKPDNAKVDAVESESFVEQRKERKKAEKKNPGAGGVDLSNALLHRLSTQFTAAACEAVKSHPAVALDITIAAVLANSPDCGAGVRLHHNGMNSHKAKGTFKTHLESMRTLPDRLKLEMLANAIGMAFDFQCHNPAAFKTFRAGGMCDLFGAEMVAAARKAFDAEDYFNSVPKALCLAAITEAINADEARKVAGKPKSDIAKFAIANVPKTGWLPPELRTAHYDGPGAGAKKAPAAKPAKKPARSKKK